MEGHSITPQNCILTIFFVVFSLNSTILNFSQEWYFQRNKSNIHFFFYRCWKPYQGRCYIQHYSISVQRSRFAALCSSWGLEGHSGYATLHRKSASDPSLLLVYWRIWGRATKRGLCRWWNHNCFRTGSHR